MEENTKNCKFKSGIDYEKIAIYIGLLVTFTTALIYVADIKERIARLEVTVESLKLVEKK